MKRTLHILPLLAVLALSIGQVSAQVTSGLQLWLKPEGLTNTTAASPISFWTNSTGSGNGATCGVAANQPAYLPNALNGYPVARFVDDGSNVAGNPNLDWLQSSLSLNANGTPFTVVIVAETQTAGARDHLIHQAGGGYPILYVETNGPAAAPAVNSFASGQILISGTAHPTRAWSVLAVVQNPTLNTLTVYKDGAILASAVMGTATALPSGPWVFGANAAKATHGLNGDIAEVLIYNQALDASNMATNYAYLAQKYGFIVLTDNFNTADTFDLEADLANRQTGSAAPAGYWWGDATIADNQASISLSSSTTNDAFSSKFNFITNESGNFKVSFDVTGVSYTGSDPAGVQAGVVIRSQFDKVVPPGEPGSFSAVYPPTLSVASYSPVWFDGFDTTAQTNNINFEIGAPRQGGAYVPTAYVANTPNEVTDWEQQLIGPGATSDRLQLASATPTLTLVSPDLNFVGNSPSGIIGKQIQLSMDIGALILGNASSYIQGGITVCGVSNLITSGSVAPHFGIRFIEDKFSGPGAYFLQFFDAANMVANVVPHSAGAGQIALDIRIDDPADGNPWDGVGSTKIDVMVNNALVYSYTKGSGGYTANHITLEGSANFNQIGLATHNFENLTVFASPVNVLTAPYHVDLVVNNNVLTHIVNNTNILGVYPLTCAANNRVSLSMEAPLAALPATATFDNFSFSATPLARVISPSTPTLKVADAFNTPDSSDLNATVAARQTGSAAPITYVTTGNFNATVGISGNAVRFINNTTASDASVGMFSPSVNFRALEHLNSFRMKFTAAGTNDTNPNNTWLGVRFRDSQAGQFVASGDGGGTGINLYPDGRWYILQSILGSPNTVATAASGTVPVAPSYDFEIQVINNIMTIRINGQSLSLGCGAESLPIPATQTANFITFQCLATASTANGFATFDNFSFESLNTGAVTAAPTLLNPAYSASGPTFSFSLNSVSGTFYAVESTPSLASPLWTQIGSFVGNGGLINYTNTPISESSQFHRVRIP